MTTDYLTNKAYGYPNRGDARRIAPRRLACIHVTANPSTPLATAQQERDYANRTNSGGPSAHSYLNRDGTWVHAIDPQKYAAWSNGVLRLPKQHVAGITEVIELDKRPSPDGGTYNPNEDYFREIETCARYPELPITVEQRQAIAEQIARDSLTTGLPIGRATVHLHSDLDTVQKPNCPVPAKDAEAWVADIIRSAREWRLRWQVDAIEAERDEWMRAALANLAERDAYLAQRDEAVAWGKRLQAFGGAILATDKPEWIE